MSNQEPTINTPPMYRDSNVFNEGGAPPANTVGEPSGEPPQAPAQNVNRDQVVSVKVDGQDVEVTLGEALDGYMRNAHFTQQMQQLRADQAQAQASVDFVRKLETDPAGTVDLIREHYQLEPGQRSEDSYGSYDEPPRPDPKVAQLERQLAQMQGQLQKAESQRQLDNQMANLQAQHGDRFDRQKVLDFAVANGHNDVQSAWQAMEFQRLSALEQGLQAQGEQRTAAQQALLDQASGVLPGIASGGSTPATTAGGPLSTDVNSVTDAFLAAKQELGLT